MPSVGWKNNFLPIFLNSSVWTNPSNMRQMNRRKSPNVLRVYTQGFHKNMGAKDKWGS